MPPTLPPPPSYRGEATAAASPAVAMMQAARRKEQQEAEEAQRKAEQQAAQEERAAEVMRLNREQNERAAAAAAAESKKTAAQETAQTVAGDVAVTAPAYGVAWDKTPGYVREDFKNRYGAPALADVPKQWDASLSKPETVSTAGQVTERDLAEKGIDPKSIPREQWATALANKLEPVKAKLDVQQKAALGSAAQAVPVLNSALDQYDKIASKAGPIMGRIHGKMNELGFGSRDFAKANAELRGNLFNVARSLQGAGVLTEKDMTRMEEIAPSLRMNREQFMGQVDAVKGLMRERLTAWRELNHSALDENQRNLVDSLIQKTSEPTGTAATEATPPAPGQATKPTTETGVRKISNAEEYNSLPSGTVFIDPSGVKRTKP